MINTLALKKYILNFFFNNHNSSILLQLCRNYNYLVNIEFLSQKELLWFLLKELSFNKKSRNQVTLCHKFDFYSIYMINNNTSFHFDKNLAYFIVCYFYGLIVLNFDESIMSCDILQLEDYNN